MIIPAVSGRDSSLVEVAIAQRRLCVSLFGGCSRENVAQLGGTERLITMINWSFFPRSDKPTDMALKVVEAFNSVAEQIDSSKNELKSNQVLALLNARLSQLGFRVETGKSKAEKIRIPVLFGRNGKLEKAFDADAYHEQEGFVLEVEAGRGVVNNQFLKDLFQACMMHDVWYVAIAVRNTYKKNQDYEIVERFFGTLYASNRLSLPLKGVLVIGY